MTLRRWLDGLYRLSGILAAVFLFLIAVTIIAQIIGRFFGVALDSTESGGFCLAGTTFLGLAHTLKSGAHIRVSLIAGRLKGWMARAVDLWSCGFAVVAMGYLAWNTAGMVHDSWRFNDLSPGLLGIPFWIPQSWMLIGIVILTIAFLDEFVIVASGREPGYARPVETALGDLPRGE